MTTTNGTVASFDVFRWLLPATTSDYPILAVARDQSLLLSLGNFSLGLDWGIPEEAVTWLCQEFAPAGQVLTCDLSLVRMLINSTFAGGAEFCIVSFDDEVRPSELRLGLTAQQDAEHAAEYVIHRLGTYQRFHRDPERLGPVTAAEHAMLDVCVSTFMALATQYRPMLVEPPPPRYRPNWSPERSGRN